MGQPTGGMQMNSLILGLAVSDSSSVVPMAGVSIWGFSLIIGLLLLVVACIRRME